MSVSFYELEKSKLVNKKSLKNFIPLIFLQEGKQLESLTVVFCSDDYLLDINKTHLNHDYYTDIITFDLSESKLSSVVGELYISIERVKENAFINKVSYNKELHRVIFHGILHLCGYKDKKKLDIIEIRQKEDEYLANYCRKV